jgi:hypothetical protein
LEFALFRIRWKKFDRGFYKAFTISVLCEEHRAAFGFAQAPKQLELPIEDLTFPLFPSVGHNSTLSKGRLGVTVIVSKYAAEGVKGISAKCP